MSKQHSIQKEQFLSFLPSLACHIGVNEAVVVQKIQWLTSCPNSGVEIDGERWVWNTVKDWRRFYFPFWSEKTIRRIFDDLSDKGVLVTCQPRGSDRTLHYRISEGMYEKFTVEALENFPCGQIVQMEPDKLSKCYRQNLLTEKGFTGGELKGSGKRHFPKSETEMYRMLEDHGVEASPERDGNFFHQMVRSQWRIRGRPIADWISVYSARIKRLNADAGRT